MAGLYRGPWVQMLILKSLSTLASVGTCIPASPLIYCTTSVSADKRERILFFFWVRRIYERPLEASLILFCFVFFFFFFFSRCTQVQDMFPSPYARTQGFSHHAIKSNLCHDILKQIPALSIFFFLTMRCVSIAANLFVKRHKSVYKANMSPLHAGERTLVRICLYNSSIRFSVRKRCVEIFCRSFVLRER